ncbi:hypothetical protein CGRA01v4_08269 [Colletotrichum graminicola]|nr:hypothetical protein CGRA01v4_08269 [Colletotrichum graminicola]
MQLPVHLSQTISQVKYTTSHIRNQQDTLPQR